MSESMPITIDSGSPTYSYVWFYTEFGSIYIYFGDDSTTIVFNGLEYMDYITFNDNGSIDIDINNTDIDYITIDEDGTISIDYDNTGNVIFTENDIETLLDNIVTLLEENGVNVTPSIIKEILIFLVRQYETSQSINYLN
jgi:hypothetical protein